MKDIYIQNLIGFVHETAIVNGKKQLYYDIFKSLFNTWSNQTSIMNTSYEQHLYLTKCILVCISYMQNEDKDTLADGLFAFFVDIPV